MLPTITHDISVCPPCLAAQPPPLNNKRVQVKAREKGFKVAILFDQSDCDALDYARHLGHELRNASMSVFHIDMVASGNKGARQAQLLNHIDAAKAFVSVVFFFSLSDHFLAPSASDAVPH